MREIKLTQGQVALVDNEDYAWLNQWKWYGLKYYDYSFLAARKLNSNVILMHRVIMNTPVDLVVDHKDHNTLNNQKFNLRNCTQSQNGGNRTPSIGNTSKYKGVSWYRQTQKWIAYIRKDGRRAHLGYFTNEQDAALAYNVAALLHFGEFALVNNITVN